MKRQFWIIITMLVGLVVAGAFFLNHELVVKYMYPHDALYRDANLAVRGMVSSVERNYVTRGLVASNYHIYRVFIRLNMTEVL
jgi:hypothetical protein